MTLLIVLALVLISTQLPPSECKPQKLILLLMDGVRWDYLDYDGLGQDGFRRVMTEGVKAEYLQSDFPTSSYPNYYSIMTGLHVESHGMNANYMYDPEKNESFLIGTNPEQFNSHWWEGGDPLWVTAVRQKKRAYFYFWPGCEVEIRGLRPTYCRNYTDVPTFNDTMTAIQEGLDQLQNDRADVVGVYFELTDYNGHWNGPLGPRVKSTLKVFDRQVAYILNEIDARGLKEEVNLMIFSDHGMTAVSPSRIVNLTEALSQDVNVILDRPVMSVWPEPGKTDVVYNRLSSFQHIKVYKKDDIPERWHYKRARLAPPILIVADLGFTILSPWKEETTFPVHSRTNESLAGAHGYDNAEQDMRGIFLAVGPAFRANHVTDPLRVVDLYQVMCSILDITPSPNNGTWDKVKDMMVTEATGDSVSIHAHHFAAIAWIFIGFLARES